MKYRKKPVVIEALQWSKTPIKPEWFEDAFMNDRIKCNFESGMPHLVITTLEGEMRAEKDDYIIQGVKGEIYPCKPDIFEMTYEVAE